MLSADAATWLNSALHEAADTLSFDRRNMFNVTPGVADEIERMLQAWRDSLSTAGTAQLVGKLTQQVAELRELARENDAATVSRALVERACDELGRYRAELIDADAKPAPAVSLAHLLLDEALS